MYLGPGPRYLLYYYGQLAITNDAGLMHWPEGPKVIVAVIKPKECTCGLSPARKAYLMEKTAFIVKKSGKDKAHMRANTGIGSVCKEIDM